MRIMMQHLAWMREVKNIIYKLIYLIYLTKLSTDEHGQSMLHFAAARQHGKNALFQLIEESGVSLTYRDEIYRSARDVSLQASQPENCKEIDRYVLSLAARGKIFILKTN